MITLGNEHFRFGFVPPTGLPGGIDPDSFHIVDSVGTEGISKLYRYELTLSSTHEVSDLERNLLFDCPIKVYAMQDRQTHLSTVHGIFASFEEIRNVDTYFFYKAVMVPKMWKLTQTKKSEIYQDLSVRELIIKVMTDAGFTTNDYELHLSPRAESLVSSDPGYQSGQGIDDVLTGAQPYNWRRWEYICQYNETYFDFLSRWMEREGIYYFFEQRLDGEKIIFTDSKNINIPLLEQIEEKFTADLRSTITIPTSESDLDDEKYYKVRYNPPSGLDAAVPNQCITSFTCRQNQVPGKVILQDFNHRGSPQVVTGDSFIPRDTANTNIEEVHLYGEHIKNIEEATFYAKIRADGIWCRRKVYYGESTFSYLRPGYTYKLTDHYKDTWKDLPYLITGIRHELDQKAVLFQGNSDIVPAGENTGFYNNTFECIPFGNIVDNKLQYRPELKTPKPRFYGTINAKVEADSLGLYAERNSQGQYKVKLPFDRSDATGQRASRWVRMIQPYAGSGYGTDFPMHKDAEVLLTFIDGDPDRPIIAGGVYNQTSQIAAATAISALDPGMATDAELAATQAALQSQIDTISSIITAGGNKLVMDDLVTDKNILTHSPGDLRFEAQGRYAEYTVGFPPEITTVPPTDQVPAKLRYMRDKFTDGATYLPTGMKLYSGYPDTHNDDIYGSGVTPDWNTLVAKGRVMLGKGDSFNTQEGNIYDFGGYWNYNLGNCYIENHIDQTAELNASHRYDLLSAGGPDWGTIGTIQGDGAHQHGGSKNELAGWDASTTHASSNNWTNIAVEKTFGDSYEYREGNSISVQKGSTHEILVSARSVEEKYSGGNKTYFRKSGGGITEEKSWSKITGLPMTYSYSVADPAAGHGKVFGYSHDWTNKIHFSTNFSASLTGSFNMDTHLDMKMSLGASLELSAFVGTKNSLTLNASIENSIKISASAGFKVDIGAAAFLMFKIAAGGDHAYVNGKWKSDFPGASVNKAAAVKADMEKFALRKMMTNLKKGDLQLIKLSLAVQKHSAGITSGIQLFT